MCWILTTNKIVLTRIVESNQNDQEKQFKTRLLIALELYIL